jgi:hypothetical protein
METILAVFGLLFLLVSAVGVGLYLGGVREVPTVTIDQAPRRRQPRGLVVTSVFPSRREVYFIADYQTAQRLNRYGKVRQDYTDTGSGDRHWILYGSELDDWGDVMAAMRGEAMPSYVLPVAKGGEIVKHQGWVQ